MLLHSRFLPVAIAISLSALALSQAPRRTALAELVSRHPDRAEMLHGAYFAKYKLVGPDLVIINLTGADLKLETLREFGWSMNTLGRGRAVVYREVKNLRFSQEDKLETFKVRPGARYAFERDEKTKRIVLSEITVPE